MKWTELIQLLATLAAGMLKTKEIATKHSRKYVLT